MKPSKELTIKEEKPIISSPVKAFTNYLDRYKENELRKLLKNHNIDPEQFIQIVVSEIKKSKELQIAFLQNPSSMFASIFAGAEIGLIPSDRGEFFLIPRKIEGKLLVAPQIGYKGIINVLLRSGEITSLDTRLVYEKDKFKVTYGLKPNITHTPNLDALHDSTTFKYVYAYATLKNGQTQFVVLSRADIEKIQSLSRFNNDLYFNDKKDPNMWMIRKCALVQLSKMLPKDYYGNRVLEIETRTEGGAVLTLDEDNQVIIENKKGLNKSSTGIKTFNSLPDLPEEYNTDN